jgi:hypothetical protein
VLDLLGQVPLEEIGRRRIDIVEQLVVVTIGPPGDAEGDRLRRSREGEREAPAAVTLEPAVAAVDPALEMDDARPVLGDAVVEPSVLAVVAGLLGAEGRRGGPQPWFEVGQGGPHGAHEVRLRVGHQQRHPVDGEGQLGVAGVPGRIETLGMVQVHAPLAQARGGNRAAVGGSHLLTVGTRTSALKQRSRPQSQHTGFW